MSTRSKDVVRTMLVPAIVVAAHLSGAVPNDSLRFDPSDPAWSEVEKETEAPSRVKRALEVFAKHVMIPPSLRPAAEILAWAAGTGRDESSTEGLVTPIQGARALTALAMASTPTRAVVDDVLAHAGSRGEQAVLLKEVAARAKALDSEETAADLHKLADKIRGKPLRWLVENTTAYGNDFEAGIKQSFKDSCMPAIKLVAEAEVDPLFAVELHEPAYSLADEEKRELEAEGGVAVARDDYEHGRGTRDHALLFILGRELDARTEVIARPDFDDAMMDRMEQLLDDGEDIPLRIAADGDLVAHSVIAVDAKRENGQRFIRVHDPWTGQSAWFRDVDVLRGHLFPTDRGVPRHVTHVYLLEP